MVAPQPSQLRARLWLAGTVDACRRICNQRPHCPHRRRAVMITGPAQPPEATRRQRPHSQPTAASRRRTNPQFVHAAVAGVQRRRSSHCRSTFAAAPQRGQRTMNSSANDPSHRPRSTNRFRIMPQVYVTACRAPCHHRTPMRPRRQSTREHRVDHDDQTHLWNGLGGHRKRAIAVAVRCMTGSGQRLGNWRSVYVMR